MKKNWLKVYQRIIKRQAPHAIFSWRYFLPGQNEMVHLHRQVFLSAWSDYPRVFWCLIALYSYTLWYLFYSWRQVFFVWNKWHKVFSQDVGVSSWRQLKGLLILALLHSTPPRFYYQYRLYCYHEREWLNFIYTHELPHWHHMMSPNISPRSQHLMSHKNDFSFEMQGLGLPAIPTVYRVKKGDEITDRQLFNRQSLFIKPECGSRKEGSYTLTYLAETGKYCIEGDEIDEGFTQVKIKRIIEQETSRQHYLIQSLLENHPLVAERCQCDKLVTIRLITILFSSKPKAVAATLEVPVEGSFTRIIPINIELKTGKLSYHSDQCYFLDRTAEQRIKMLSGVLLPQWFDVIRISEQAHQNFLDIHSIGWDLAITPYGIKLIEGNINWAVAQHQQNGYFMYKCFAP